MRVGILTGGGDCPGVNAALRAIVRKGEHRYGDELVGFRGSWSGLLDDRAVELDVRSGGGLLVRGGTLLGSRHGSPFDHPDGPERVRDALARHRLDALVVVGGLGTLTVACRLQEQLGLPIVGVPKTVENDVVGADLTFGFTTAVEVATDAIDRLQIASESDHRVVLVEVMGRHAGWIATIAGIAGGAAAILIPELPFDPDRVGRYLAERQQRGRSGSVVVVAEGVAARGPDHEPPALDRSGHVKHGGTVHILAPELEQRTGFETHVVDLGQVQRGGTPTAYDRVLATRYGLAAIDAVHDGAWGQMVVYRGGRMERAPMRVAMGRIRTIDLDVYHDVAEMFFG
jgi:6-phosphofructokinase 1